MARKSDNSALTDPFLEKAHRRFRHALDYWTPHYQRALMAWEFCEGEQWDEGIKARRLKDKLPCLTIRRIKQPIRQISNEQRQNRPAVQYSPVSDDADEMQAEIRQGLYRHIEVSSDADVARDTAFESAIRGGFGYYRVTTDYPDPDSDDQDIFVKPVLDFTTCFPDPAATPPDYADARYWFVFEDIPEEEYKDIYGEKSELTSFGAWSSLAGQAPEWFPSEEGEKMIRVAEYWYVDTTYEQKKKRRVEKRTVKWARLNGREVIEERDDYKGKWIPLVAVLGEDYRYGGKRKIKGLVSDTEDAQRMYNYASSAFAEGIGVASKAKYLVTARHIQDYQEMWDNMNDPTTGYLVYNPDPAAGTPPLQQSFNPPVAALSEWRAQSIDDIQATSGTYDPSLGKLPRADASGRAIAQLQQQGEIANFHYSDNLTRALRHEARIVDDLMPIVYDSERVIHIVKPDATTEAIAINHDFPPRPGMKTFDPSVGKYDIVIQVGPSYKTRRQQSEAAMLEFLKILPEPLAAQAAYLVPKMADFPGAKEFSDAITPPQVKAQQQQQANGGPNPQALQAQLQQFAQQHQALVQQLNQLMQERETKQLELTSKERIAALEVQAKLVTALAQMKSQEALVMAKQEYDKISNALGMAHEAGMAAMDHAHTLAQTQHASDVQGGQQASAAPQQQVNGAAMPDQQDDGSQPQEPTQ